MRELRHALELTDGAEVLNLGSGPFLELAKLPRHNKRFTLCDIDGRALELAKEIHGAALVAVDTVVAGAPLPYPDQRFDAVVSMDVVEHLLDPLPWLEGALRVLKPGGLLFLTTPNYASSSLRVLENTVLEAVARGQGFSRRDLHPSKLDTSKLSALLAAAGARNTRIKRISFGWALAAFARR
ncbi:MAG TPA: class I SAM-dependent methyltransferase [Polyangiaceae bacterium]|nr:class I SAM-dependent methyltransferase [Polyangiaceae bacterium]